MAKYYAKLTRKYLLNVVVHGFSKALKLGECTFMMIYLSNLLHFAKNIGFMTLHGGLVMTDILSSYFMQDAHVAHKKSTSKI